MEEPRDANIYSDNGYALSGKIMLSAIVILFFVVILMVCLHLYARWYLFRARRRHHHVRRSRHRRTHLVFLVDSTNPVSTASRGLDDAVLKSLPVFVYSSKTHQAGLDCAVCLSEFEEGESGRVLPKCNHSFHIGCIDMWFHSHSTCPLCRSPVEPGRVETEEVGHVVVSVTEPGSSSGMCDTCRQEEGLVETTSSGDRGKREFVGVSIEVPTRNHNEGFESESTGCDSASSHTQTPSSFRSPVSRMLSFKRILSRERRGNVPSSPSSGIVESCSVAEPDLERGRDETEQTQ